jgi:tRNA threonylcarbamoyladenosine biosynthesis protein TsaE
METSLQPSHQASLRAGQIHRADADLGKSQGGSFPLQRQQQPFGPCVGLSIQVSTGNIHLTILETRNLAWPDEASCALTAQQMATRPGLDDALLTLHGELGAGKTTFTRHLLQALGVEGSIKSPTYALVELYEAQPGPGGAGFPVSHFDFYRFEDPQEWEDAGLRELVAGPGLKLVEWPEMAGSLLPRADLAIHIALGEDDRRSIRFDALSPRGQGLLP